MTTFDYSNLSGRPPGPVVSALSHVHRGVRSVMAQVPPYAWWWEESNRAALTTGRPLWIALGDSLTQGIGASAPDRGWVGRLVADPPPRAQGTALVNLSFNGARVADVLDRQLPALHRLDDLGHEVALVTLLIGNNDLVSRRWRRSLVHSMRALLDQVPDGTVVATQPGTQPAALRFNDVVDDVAARRGLPILEYRVPQMRSWRGKLAADHFHPNDAGYAGMADLARRALGG